MHVEVFAWLTQLSALNLDGATQAVDYLQLCIGRHPLKQHHRFLAPTVFSRRLGVLHRKTTRQRGQDIALEASAVLAFGATGTVRRATAVAGRQET